MVVITGVLSAHDEQDPTSISEQSREKARTQQKDWSSRSSLTDLRGLRIGVPLVSSPNF